MSLSAASGAHGFVLESADSVRFGPEYTLEEIERNRQVLFGELLCGLLMGEPVWTNAVFAFDSKGMVEVLGAISRAFLRIQDREQFLPFVISAYPQDKDPWTKAMRPWSNASEFFLRCYAHRLKNTDFQLSATPELHQDVDRRVQWAEKLLAVAGTDEAPDLSSLPETEQSHFRSLFSIDRYLRSWLGKRASIEFDQYSNSALTHDMPIRLIRSNWQHRYASSQDANRRGISKLRFFLERADQCSSTLHVESSLLADATNALAELLKLPAEHECFGNRSLLRTQLRQMQIIDKSPTFRLLIELVDGHYIRTQYTELSYSAREVTSPASKTEASQIGETWAAHTMQSCLSPQAAAKPWQFINCINAVPNENTVTLNLDDISSAFADFVSHPDRRGDLAKYHELLALAREVQGINGGSGDDAKSRFNALRIHVSNCIDKINLHMSSSGVQFHFNTDDEATCAGSLTMTYRGNRSTRQCSGPNTIEIDKQANDQSKPFANEPKVDVSRGFDNHLYSTKARS